jgi:hypothetical protein
MGDVSLYTILTTVIAGLDPAIHSESVRWMG